MNPFGQPPGPGITYSGKSNSVFQRLQDHFDDDPVWDSTTDSITTAAFAPANTVNSQTLIRVSKLPVSTCVAIVLSASSAGNEQNPPAPAPAIPWFIVSCGTEGAFLRYRCFSGVEIVGGTSVIVENINIPWAGGAAAPLFVRARAWLTGAAPAMNVVEVL